MKNLYLAKNILTGKEVVLFSSIPLEKLKEISPDYEVIKVKEPKLNNDWK